MRNFARALLMSALVALNCVVWCLPVLGLAFVRFFVANKDSLSNKMVSMAESWIAFNSALLDRLQSINWLIADVASLHKDRSYLICANHLSAVDIVALQYVLNRRIPFMRFFIKSELRYVPLLGGVWRALDFPFMKRRSAKPDEDLKTTQHSCAQLHGRHISLMNFAEGTRYSAKKCRQQHSPYRHLLKPKSGAMTYALHEMGDQFHSMLDVTIDYPAGAPSLWDLFSGRVHDVTLVIDEVPIPRAPKTRDEVSTWLNQVWRDKDALLTQMRNDHRGAHFIAPAPNSSADCSNLRVSINE